MGLLDDAIREHLELKRRRGADPGEVAREQHEALDDPRDIGAGPTENPSPLESAVAPQLASNAAVSDLLEETAELDMQSVLDQRADVADAGEMAAGSPEAGSPVDRVPAAAAGEQPPQSEVPTEGVHGYASEASVPAADPREPVSGEGEEHVHQPAEDLVADMTDGPRDASEQDRLWSEPNATRDVDADK